MEGIVAYGEDQIINDLHLDWEVDSERPLEELEAELRELTPTLLRGIMLLEQIGHKTGGRIPRWAFETFPRIIPQFSFELMVLRPYRTQTPIEPEVFMVERPEDDPHWAGELHAPGTAMYMLDTIGSMWTRLMSSELLTPGKVDPLDLQPIFGFLTTTTREERKRGPGMHAVYYAWLPPKTTLMNGRFFPLGHLPDNTIAHHARMMHQLLEHLNR